MITEVPLQLFTISTLNFQIFSELAFSFTLTFEIFYKSLLFSLIMGFVGGVLPAFRAARKNIVEASRVTCSGLLFRRFFKQS